MSICGRATDEIIGKFASQYFRRYYLFYGGAEVEAILFWLFICL